MKLNALQSIWLLAGAALFATVLLDIAGIMQVPPLYWMAGFGLLAGVGWWVMPSLADLKKRARPPRG